MKARPFFIMRYSKHIEVIWKILIYWGFLREQYRQDQAFLSSDFDIRITTTPSMIKTLPKICLIV